MRPILSCVTTLAFLVVAGAATAVAQPPVITPGGIVNAASNQTPVALGSLVSIYGTNLSPQTDVAPTVPLPITIDGVKVLVNNVLAPLQLVSSGQINAQIPWEALPAGPPTTNTSATVIVTTLAGGQSVSANVTIGPAGPGIFTFNYGIGQAVAYSNGDGAIASATPIANYPYHAAKIGDPLSLVIYATGLGAVSPAVQSGNVPPTGVIANTVTTPTVLVGGVAAQVLFSGLTPQFPGFYQLNVVIQPGTPTGSAVPLQIQMGAVTSPNTVTIAVSN